MPPDPRARGARTRLAIIEAAYHTFLLRGFHGASMRQIAAEAGIAVGGIYNHFKSKDDIFVAVLVEHHPYTDVLPAFEAAQGETIEAFVHDAARRLVGDTGERRAFLNLMFIELVEFNGHHVPQLFQVIFPQALQFARRFFEGRPELRPIPLPIILRAFVGLFFSYLITELLIGAQFSPELQGEVLDGFVDIFLHGILEPQVPA